MEDDKFRVMREDYGGNKFPVGEPFDTEEEAKIVRDMYENRGHHQFYWVEEIKEETPPLDNSLQ